MLCPSPTKPTQGDKEKVGNYWQKRFF